MAIRFIDKYAGSGATDAPVNRSGAAGFAYDSVTGKVNLNGNGTLTPMVDESTAQTLSNKNVLAPVTTQAVDGAIAISSGVVWLTKGSAAAMTLAAPTAAQVGTEITIVAGSAFAHVVTATGLINNGTTGGPHNTFTTAAFKGSSITLIATPDLLWSTQAQVLGTVA
jgi:hypothetical protein